MSEEPRLPEPSPELPRPPPFPSPPWGAAGVIVGLLPILALTLLPLLVDAPVDAGELEALPVARRYAGFLFVQGLLIGIAFAAAFATRAGTGGLGLRWVGAGALVGPALGGAGLVAFSHLWGLLLSWAAPSAFEQMMSEQAEQMKLLEAPWALLVPAAVLLAPLGEEIYFRGFVFGGLRRDFAFPLASGLSAAVFAGIHLMGWSTVPLFFVGIGAAIAYEQKRTLYAPLALHAAFNGTALLSDVLLGP